MTRDAVPSGLLSSTTRMSTSGAAALTRSMTVVTLPASSYVGMITTVRGGLVVGDGFGLVMMWLLGGREPPVEATMLKGKGNGGEPRLAERTETGWRRSS